MKVFGVKTSSTAEENLCFKMDSSMKEIFTKARNMDQDYTNGETEISIMENLFATKEKEQEAINGMMVLLIEVNGEQIE